MDEHNTVYANAVEHAKKELDEILPTFEKMQERVTLLRKWIGTGTMLVGDKIESVDDKYLPSFLTMSAKHTHSPQTHTRNTVHGGMHGGKNLHQNRK